MGVGIEGIEPRVYFTEEQWTKGTLARNRDGEPTFAEYGWAASACVYGHIMMAYRHDQRPLELKHFVRQGERHPERECWGLERPPRPHLRRRG